MIKVIKKNQPTRKEIEQPKVVEPEEYEVMFLMTNEDHDAFRNAKKVKQSRDWKSMNLSNADIIKELLQERKGLKEIFLTDQSDIVNKHYITLEKSLHDELYLDAKKAGLSIREYIRGIIYTRGTELAQIKHNERLEQQAKQHDHRIILAEIPLDKQSRESLYKIHGKVTDKELKEIVKKEFVNYLNELR